MYAVDQEIKECNTVSSRRFNSMIRSVFARDVFSRTLQVGMMRWQQDYEALFGFCALCFQLDVASLNLSWWETSGSSSFRRANSVCMNLLNAVSFFFPPPPRDLIFLGAFSVDSDVAERGAMFQAIKERVSGRKRCFIYANNQQSMDVWWTTVSWEVKGQNAYSGTVRTDRKSVV